MADAVLMQEDRCQQHLSECHAASQIAEKFAGVSMSGSDDHVLSEARNLVIPIFAPQMIFSGYVLPLKSLPSYFHWLYYSSYWQYCVSLLQVSSACA